MTDTASNFSAILRDIWDTLLKAARYGQQAIASTSWTNLALGCVFLAVVLTVIPLAIGLFLIVVVVKLALSAVQDRRRGKVTPYQDVPPMKDKEQ